MFSAHARFDEQTWAVERLELESHANYGRLGVNLLYGDYAAQPLLGFLTRREGVVAGASYKLTSNWVVLGQVGYDLAANQFNLARAGLGYTDDCFMLAFNYITSYAYNGTSAPVANSTFMLQLSLRTLGPDSLGNAGTY
jgi:LPS-assembly protein